MLLTVERVLLLHQVEMFHNIDEDALIRLATALKEQDARPGEVIIKEGELGRELYIIIDGKVRVHLGEKEFTTLGSKAIFGEMAALDPQPRSASVTAIDETRLLRLDHETLFDELVGNNELAQGVVRFLVRRLRKVIGELAVS
jgi:CRP-like cAMP-binding protein